MAPPSSSGARSSTARRGSGGRSAPPPGSSATAWSAARCGELERGAVSWGALLDRGARRRFGWEGASLAAVTASVGRRPGRNCSSWYEQEQWKAARDRVQSSRRNDITGGSICLEQAWPHSLHLRVGSAGKGKFRAQLVERGWFAESMVKSGCVWCVPCC